MQTPEEVKNGYEMDCRCHCSLCEARTQETYRLSLTCINCGWEGTALIRKGDKFSSMRECPHCGVSWVLHAGTDPDLAESEASHD